MHPGRSQANKLPGRARLSAEWDDPSGRSKSERLAQLSTAQLHACIIRVTHRATNWRGEGSNVTITVRTARIIAVACRLLSRPRFTHCPGYQYARLPSGMTQQERQR